MDDLISRQAAIDAADKIIERDTSGNNDVVKAMTAWKMYVEALPSAQPDHIAEVSKKDISSVQPEIIYCKDCKYHHRDNSGAYYCERKEYGYGWVLNDFCSDAERKTDGGLKQTGSD